MVKEMMKNHVFGIILIVFILLITSIFSAASFESMKNKTSEYNSFIISFSANPFTISPKDDGTVTIAMNNFTTMLRSGYPRLPVITEVYELPSETVIDQVNIVKAEAEWLQQSFIIEQASPLTNGTHIFSQPPVFNSSLFPSNPVELVFTGSLGSYDYCALRFYPMAYAPENQSILLYHNVSVKITYTHSPQVSSAQPTQMHSKIESRAHALFEKNTSNRSSSFSQPLQTNERYPYVIICPEQLTSSVTFLKNWREITTDSPVKIVNLEWIQTQYNGRDVSEQIREFLKDKYIDWEIEYVLLVGSVNTIPMRLCYPNKEDHSYQTVTPTDYYYADLTGDWDSDEDGYFGEREDDNVDFSAEVFVGRIPFDSPKKVEAYCQKVIRFEQNNESWKDKSLLLGAILNFANEDESGYEKTDGAALMEVMKQDVFSPNECRLVSI
jgi:hypothetical protein